MNIDEDISVTMQVNGITLNTPTKEENSLRYSSTYTLTVNNVAVAKEYRCKVTITSTSQYIIANNNSMASTDLIIKCKL